MAIIQFGDQPADMSADTWGFIQYVSEDTDPEILSTSASELLLRDPLTLSTIRLTGSFDLFALLLDDLSTSSVSSAELRSSDGSLLFAASSPSAPIPLADFFSDDENADVLGDLIAGNDTITGSTASDLLLGADGNDRIEARSGDDTVLGGNGNDTMYGGEGDDWFEAGPGSDFVDGGDGVDTVVFAKTLPNYAASLIDGQLTVQDQSGDEGSDVLVNVERVELPGQGFAFDIWQGQQAGEVLALLAAAFGPTGAADPALFGQWLQQRSGGASLEDIAQQIIDAYAPSGFTIQDEIVHLYFTIIGELPTQDVIDHFAGLGLSQSELYVLASGAAENWQNLQGIVLQGYAEYAPDLPIG